MITEARRKKITELVEKEGVVNLQQLTDTFNVSIYTIRRDLTALEKEGFLKKAHGGAIRIEKSKWISSIEEGKFEALEEKQKIAKLAATLIEDGDTIMLMGSIISLLMIPFIQNKNITIVTNSLDIAKELCQIPNIETIMIGGTIKNYKGNILGSKAISDLKNYHFDKAFIPCAGIKDDPGVTTSTLDSSDFLKGVIQSSRKKIIVADYRKIGRITFAHVCNIKSVHMLITDAKSNEQELNKIRKKGIQVEVV
ncbi:DeoR/GlpR family DNA-binding transcription regulator [Inediibacterium massiliense]|uniref:DeoR/GlpR family DNA-binding transcription regulator n=1 Tax=Inediibacterium massiliense TaxID=1658111 RepID=UPI0006B5DC28|nr:DeoR/GlpR family DNA-binding transcription regulator [Inediibacterium massiliense]